MAKKKAESFPYRERRILLIDLGKELSKTIVLETDDAKRMLGGPSMSKTLWLRYAGELASEQYEAGNPLVFASGAASDLAAPEFDGFSLTTCNPVTSRVSTYTAHGPFSKVFSGLGVSAIVIVGRRSRITVLDVGDLKIAFSTDESFHNMTTSQVTARFPSSHVVTLGPAGEQQVPISTIAIDGKPFGRSGLGLVFARKNLKVIAFHTVPRERNSYRTEEIGPLRERYGKFVSHQKSYPLPLYAKRLGWAAVNGFRDRTDGRLWALEREKDFVPYFALGTNLGVFEPKRIEPLVDLSRELGLDAASAGIILLYGMEKKGLGKEEFLHALEGIAWHKGTWMDLSEAVPPDFFRIGGMWMLPFDLRALPSMALLMSMGDETFSYGDMVNPLRLRRGDELVFVKRAMISQDLSFLMESVGLSYAYSFPYFCSPYRFFANPYDLLSKIVTATEGYPLTVNDLKERATQGWRLQKELDKKSGYRMPLTVPHFFMTDPTSNYRHPDVVVLPRMLDLYFSLRERK